ncbi:MAG: phosphoribosylamine--glycine ligase [bacterium]|jgi:phosphoribosylamine--glycine ligase
MKVLVIGGGGREHALIWKLARDSCRPVLFCAPGNAGTAELATNVAIEADNIPALVEWAMEHHPDLVVVGPEAPLCAGLTDALEAGGIRVFGPSMAAAKLEGSKVFAKDVMVAAGVPAAQSSTFTDAQKAIDFINDIGIPIVIKAEGLAAGKGVTVCATREEAERAIKEALVEGAFGEAGRRILVEEFLEGEEVSVLALTDGEHIVLLASAQDHKRVFDGDRGPNTGGMGAYSPAPVLTAEQMPAIEREVFGRTLAELKSRGITYKGVLFAGLMMTKNGPMVLEFNCRFGDPETQVILPRIEGDLIPALEACINGTLSADMIRYKSESCVCVVMAAGGYPGPYQKGKKIGGLKAAARLAETVVFHAGTRCQNGDVLTAGGRVLGVTALGDTLKNAVDRAYVAVKKISFDGALFRRDIAAKAFNKG